MGENGKKRNVAANNGIPHVTFLALDQSRLGLVQALPLSFADGAEKENVQTTQARGQVIKQVIAASSFHIEWQIMSVLKSVIITLPKGLSKVPGGISGNEFGKSVPKFNFTTSILADKKMDPRRLSRHEDMQDDGVLFKTDVCVRGKKRRLDHLTWEEKLQRKKLKNRVAAQTSRDRKKAKLDELEDTVRALREHNELLTQECTVLRSQNELLVTETKRLRKERETRNSGELICSMCQSRVSCAVSSLGSTVSPVHPLQQGGTTQPAPSLTLTPGAAILLKILTIYLLLKNCLATSKGTITSSDSKNLQKAFCERLPQKWKQILREQMNKEKKKLTLQVSVEEDTTEKRDHSERVVGQAPKDVEASRASRSMNTYQSWHPVSSTATTACTATVTAPVSIKSEVEVKEEVDTHDLDTVYGTYDESTNSITIIYPGDENSLGIQECVQEVSTDGACSTEDSSHLTPNYPYSNQFSPSYTCTDSMSPSSIHSEDVENRFAQTKLDSNASDCGYESHGSPAPDVRNEKVSVALTDLWHESFSELFPTLA